MLNIRGSFLCYGTLPGYDSLSNCGSIFHFGYTGGHTK
jgi:hypothetical protein